VELLPAEEGHASAAALGGQKLPALFHVALLSLISARSS
jgi:hypothetical protein